MFWFPRVLAFSLTYDNDILKSSMTLNQYQHLSLYLILHDLPSPPLFDISHSAV